MKNRQGKRIFPLFLTAMMVLAVSAACSSNSSTGGKGGSTAGNNGNASAGKGSGSQAGSGHAAGPSAGYPASFTYWAPLDKNVAATEQSLNDVGMYKDLQKITGTKVKFDNPTGSNDELKQKFNLLLASRNLPDVIEFNWLGESPRGPQNAIDSGTILKLNDLIDKYAPNLKQYLSDHPDAAKAIKTDKGDIYSFPFIRGDKSLMVYFGPIMRADWLKKLNLQPPKTIDEWTHALTAFKNGDPNGDGKKDEIPFEFDLNNVLSSSKNELIGAWGIGAQFYQVNGKVHFGELEPQFKDFVSTMHDWYQKGLIDPNFAATNRRLLDAKVTNDKIGAFYSYDGSGIGKYMGLMKNKEPSFNLIGLQNPTLKPGEKPVLGQMSSIYPGEGSAAITTKAKHPEQIVKWLDYAYGQKGHMLFNFGVEGKSYSMVNGYPKYTKTITDNPKLPMTQAMDQWFRAAYNGPFVQDKRYIEQYYQLPQQKKAYKTWSNAKNAIMMPPVTMTAQENKEYANIMNNVNTYTKEMVTKFIMGTAPMSDYDKFVSTLKGFNIERAINIQQAALNRYNSR